MNIMMNTNEWWNQCRKGEEGVNQYLSHDVDVVFVVVHDVHVHRRSLFIIIIIIMLIIMIIIGNS